MWGNECEESKWLKSRMTWHTCRCFGLSRPMCPAGNWVSLSRVMSQKGDIGHSWLCFPSLVFLPYIFYINYPFKKCHHFFKKDFFPYSHSSISVEVAPWQVVPLGCTSGPGPLRMYSLKQELINLFFKWLHSPSKTFIFMGHIVSVATTHLCHR